MAKDQTKRIKPSILSTDRDGVAGLKTITGYAPANAAFTASALQTAQGNMDNAQSAEAQAQAALDAARDNAVAAEWEYHNKVVGMRDQVVAQFGRDSNEAQAVGRKKESERKSPRRASKKGGAS